MPASTKQIVFDISASAAAWVGLMSVGQWARIGGGTVDLGLSATNTLLDAMEPSLPANVLANGGYGGIMEAYGSALFASGYGVSGGLVPHTAGHNSYQGNGIEVFDLATRTWTFLTRNYLGVSWPDADGVWPGGTPAMGHSFNGIQYVPRLNALVYSSTQTTNAGGQNLRPCFFDFDTLTWSFSTTPSTDNPDHTAYLVYDITRDCTWSEGGSGSGSFARYNLLGGDGAGGLWTHHENVNGGYLDQVALIAYAPALDPTKDILVIASDGGATSLKAVDLTAAIPSAATLTQSGRPITGSRHTWDWCMNLGAIIYWRGGADVYKITKGAGSFSAATYTWSQIPTTGSGPTWPYSSAGWYQQGRVCEWGAKSALVVTARHDGAVYACRLS